MEVSIQHGHNQKVLHKFDTLAKQVNDKGRSRAGINAVRLNVKDFLPQKFKGDRSQFKPRADEVMLFLSIEEPRRTAILGQLLQTICQPINGPSLITMSTQRLGFLSGSEETG
eukprot:926082-Amphidinium_carterae.1